MDDSALLRQFAQTGSHAAFRDLVGRYTSLVYASALTRLRDAHAAQDVTQAVFLTLALKAKDLRPDTSLPGWLFTTTRYVAARYQRGEQRRQEREMRAFEQHQLHQPEAPLAVWEDLRPHLAGALDSLSGADREAVLLRFYRQASHRQIAEQLRISENAAEKRVRKALDKLRRLFAKKGVTLSVAGLAGGLTASASAAPVGLAGVVSGAVLTGAGGTLAATETLMLAKGALKAMFIAKVKTVSLAAAACIVVAGTGIVAAKQLSAPASTPPPTTMVQRPVASPATTPPVPMTLAKTNSQPVDSPNPADSPPYDAGLFAKAPVVLRVKNVRSPGGEAKRIWYQADVVKVLKYDHDAIQVNIQYKQRPPKDPAELKSIGFISVDPYSARDASEKVIPDGASCTVYLDYFAAGTWSLLGSSSKTGVSHSSQPLTGVKIEPPVPDTRKHAKVNMELIISQDQWPMPARGGSVKLADFVLRITNQGDEEIWVNLFNVFRMTVSGESGPYLPDEHQQEKPVPVLPVRIAPDAVHEAAFGAALQFFAGRDLPSLVVADGSGGTWVFHGLSAGNYLVRLLYANKLSITGQITGAKDIPLDAPLWVAEAGTNKKMITIQP